MFSMYVLYELMYEVICGPSISKFQNGRCIRVKVKRQGSFDDAKFYLKTVNNTIFNTSLMFELTATTPNILEFFVGLVSERRIPVND